MTDSSDRSRHSNGHTTPGLSSQSWRGRPFSLRSPVDHLNKERNIWVVSVLPQATLNVASQSLQMCLWSSGGSHLRESDGLCVDSPAGCTCANQCLSEFPGIRTPKTSRMSLPRPSEPRPTSIHCALRLSLITSASRYHQLKGSAHGTMSITSNVCGTEGL